MKKIIITISFVFCLLFSKAQEYYSAHSQVQMYLIQKIYLSGGCDTACQKRVVEFNTLHSTRFISDSDFEDLLKGELDLIRRNKLIYKNK